MVLFYYRDADSKQVWGWHLFSRNAPLHVLHPRRNDRYRDLRGKANQSYCGASVNKVKYNWLLHSAGTLFHLTIVTNHFHSTRFTYKIYTSNDKTCTLHVTRLEADGNISSATCKHGSKNLTLTAIQWIKRMDTDSRQTETAASTALPAIKRNVLNEE
jgi:hypothetical protein